MRRGIMKILISQWEEDHSALWPYSANEKRIHAVLWPYSTNEKRIHAVLWPYSTNEKRIHAVLWPYSINEKRIHAVFWPYSVNEKRIHTVLWLYSTNEKRFMGYIIDRDDPRPQSMYIWVPQVYVPSSEVGLSQPLSRQRVYPSTPKPGGGGTLACGWRVGGVPIPSSDDLRKSLALCLVPRPYSTNE
jgi:hypothetical protein